MSGQVEDVRVHRDEVGIHVMIPVNTAAEPVDSELSHSSDYTAVNRDGVTYTFTRLQASVMRLLFDARRKGFHFVRQEVLLRSAESFQGRLRDLFRDHAAWGELIVTGAEHGGRPGQYRIAP